MEQETEGATVSDINKFIKILLEELRACYKRQRDKAWELTMSRTKVTVVDGNPEKKRGMMDEISGELSKAILEEGKEMNESFEREHFDGDENISPKLYKRVYKCRW